jgi:AcrR family transcriptional regulator
LDLAEEVASLPGSRSALEPSRAIKPGRHGFPPDAVAASQRGRLIDAFARVAAERGYSGTTIGRVTDAAGVSKKTFYVHFTDLEDCFLAAYEYGFGILFARMCRAYEAAPSWREAIRATLRVLFETLAAEAAFARISIIETNAAGQRVRNARTLLMAKLRRFFADADLPPVPDAVLDATIGGIYSTIHDYLLANRTAELSELLPIMTYFALLPLVGKEDAAKELAAADNELFSVTDCDSG